MRFGLSEPAGQMVPRFIFTGRAGPIPLSALLDVAGPVDPETSAPEPGVPLPHKEFTPVEGVVPMPPPKVPALAEQEFGEARGDTAAAARVKQASPGRTGRRSRRLKPPGSPADTGITSYDLDDDEDDEEDERAELAKAELAAFRRFEPGPP